ncbi:MAG TPA: PAS domain S-box protein [Thermoanaerobaculia bacterium]|nr:PAS domain S-box protein [Thermoanaerobaculia bacterium]
MTPFRVLLIEDDADDALLIADELRHGGWTPEIVRVDSEAGLAAALESGPWPLVIADFFLPGFSGMRALEMVRAVDGDTPFIMVSGSVSEATAVDAMRAGAADYVMKDNLARLSPAVHRELLEADVRREKRRLADSLRIAQERFRSVFEQAPVGMVVLDGEGRWVDANERLCRITGWTRAELLASDSRLYRDLIVADGEPVSERAFVRRDGSRGWMEITISRSQRPGGGNGDRVAMVEDITGRRQVAERLDLQRHLLDSVQQAVIATDVAGRITYWNRFAEQLYGWPEAEVVGRHIMDITPAGVSAAIAGEVLARLRRGESWSGEMTLQRRDGTLFTGWVTDAPITGPDGELLGIVGVSVDITEQKTAIDALRLRESQLAEAQEIANIGSWEYDLRTGARMWSDQIFRMHGLEKGPPAIEKTMGMIHPDDREEIEETFEDARRNAVPAEVEYRIVRPDGRIRTLHERGRVVHDENGKPLKVVGYVQDITERVAIERELTRRSQQQEAIADLSQMALAGAPSAQLLEHAQKLVNLGLEGGSDEVLHAPAHAETLPPHDSHFIRSVANVLAEARERELARQELVASEARYRSVIEGATEIIFTLDPEGMITSLNPAFERITGRRVERWIGRHFTELIDPADHERAILSFEQVKRGGRSSAEYAILRADGTRATLATSMAAKMEKGRAVQVHGFSRDVTEARFVEAESQRVTRELQLLLESTDEGICTIDLDGRVTLVNRSAAHLIGDSVDELMGARLHDRIHPKCAGCAIESVLLGGAGTRVHEDVFLRAGVIHFPVEYAVAPIIDDGAVKGAVHTFNDVTSRLQLEAQLEQAHRLTSLGRLAATIAHEFNNVLMGISPFVELLRRPDQSPERRLDCLDHIGKSVKRGKRITEEILRFTNPAEPVLDAVDVMSWSDAFALDARSILGVRHTLAVHVTSSGLKVLADAAQLHQIVMNLVLNARDAMPDGGVVALTMGVERRDGGEMRYGVVRDPASHLHISVEDHGCGMTPETLRHIFEPLFTTKRTGTGLGLAVTHQVVMRHGGQLFVESTPGMGTTFHIFLPLAADSAEPRRERRPDQRPLTIRRVLLVEDEPAVASGLSRLLEAEGLEVSIVRDGAGVPAAIERETPDVVVLDIGLPDMEGTQVYARIAAHYPMLPVLFSTGHGGDEQNLEQYLTRPHVGLLMKPYDVRKLMEALATVVA